MGRHCTNMSFDFPNSPTQGQEYTAIINGLTYVFMNNQWYVKSTDAPADGNTYGRRNNTWVITTGGAGAAGGTGEFVYNSTVTEPPGGGQVRLNAAQASATKLWISYTTAPGTDIKTYLLYYIKSGVRIYIQDKDDSAKWVTYDVNADAIDRTTYCEVNVTYKSGGASLPAGQRVLVTITAAGAAGTIVGVGVPGSGVGNPGQFYIDSTTGIMYGPKGSTPPEWVPIVNTTIVTGDAIPTNVPKNTLWYETDSGNTFLYHDDGDSLQWVQINAVTAGAAGTGGGSVAWTDITGKPSTFPPTLPIAQSGVTNLVSDLSLKLDASAYTAADVLSKVETLDGSGSGLDSDLLDGQHATAFAASSHTHSESDITNLTTDLAGKAPLVHTHAESDITNLVSDLAGKAPTVHTHAQSDITNLTTDLGAKEPGISMGTTAQYWRGDKSWQTFPTIPTDDVIGGIITISSTAPSSPSTGDVWIDTT
jgi:hypothetical protein